LAPARETRYGAAPAAERSGAQGPARPDPGAGAARAAAGAGWVKVHPAVAAVLAAAVHDGIVVVPL